MNGDLPDETDGTDGLLPTDTADGELSRGSVTTYTGFDHAGNVSSYTYSQVAEPYYNTPAFGANYSVNYIRKDGYLEQSTSGAPTVSGYVPATDISYYDAFGRRMAVSQTSESDTGTAKNATSIFAYNTAGEIVQRRTGTVSGSTFTADGGAGTTHYTYVEGQQVGSVDENGGIHVLDTLTGFIDSTSSQSYVVQSGDTLETIAQAVYGDSRYAYILADTNGLGLDDNLVMGQSITLPSITTSSNTANTFKPYNPNEIVGSTTPNLPTAPPPPPSQAGCSVLAEIVIVAVVVVASIFTAGLAAEAAAGTLGSVGFGATMSAGLSAMTGGALGVAAGVGTTAGAIGGAAAAGAAFIGGALGNAVGQGVGDALGVSHGFSWGEALAGGLTAAAGSAIGSQLGDVNQGLVGSGQWENAALSAAETSLAGTAANKITGVATHFSWASVAASAIASAATAEVAPALDKELGLSPYGVGGDFTNRFVNGALDMQVGRQLGLSTPVDYGRVAEDAFGNAIADSMDGQDAALQARATQQAEAKKLIQAQEQLGKQLAHGQKSPFDIQPLTFDIAGGQNAKPLSGYDPSQLGYDPSNMLSRYNAQGFQALAMATSSGFSTNQSWSNFDDTLGTLAKAPLMPFDAQESKAYDEALYLHSGDVEGATDAAMAVGVREQVDIQRAAIAGATDLDPDVAAYLNGQLNVVTDALLAKDAYFTDANGNGIPELLPSGVTRLTDASQLAPVGLTPDLLHPNDGSGFSASAYYDKNQGSFIIADKGTAALIDWKANLAQGVGLTSAQYDDAFKIANSVLKYSDNPQDVIFVGHSLGGGLASLQSLRTGDPGVTFNAAGLSPLTLSHYGVSDSNAKSLIQAYYVNGEVLSTLQDFSPLPSALGTRIPITAYGEPQITAAGLQVSSPVSFFQRLNPMERLNLHSMGTVIGSIYSTFSVFGY